MRDRSSFFTESDRFTAYGLIKFQADFFSNRRGVHRAAPSGVGPQAILTTSASILPIQFASGIETEFAIDPDDSSNPAFYISNKDTEYRCFTNSKVNSNLHLCKVPRQVFIQFQ